MPLNNYFNPQGAAPDIGWKPDGFLGGMLFADREKKFQDMHSLQDIATRQAISRSGMENQDYALDAPVRQAKRGADIATHGAVAETIGGQKRAELEDLQLKNREKRGTIESDIATKIAENAGKQGEAGLAQLQRAITMATIAQQALGMGPAGGAYLKSKGFDMSDPLIRGALSSPNPQQAFAQLQKVLQAANQQLIQARERNASQEKIAKGNNETSLEVARINASARQKNLMSSWTRAVSMGNPIAIMTVGELLLDEIGDPNDPRYQSIFKVVDQARRAFATQQAGRQQGVEDLRTPGATGNRIRNFMQPPGPAIPGAMVPGPHNAPQPQPGAGGPNPNDPLGLRSR